MKIVPDEILLCKIVLRLDEKIINIDSCRQHPSFAYYRIRSSFVYMIICFNERLAVGTHAVHVTVYCSQGKKKKKTREKWLNQEYILQINHSRIDDTSYSHSTSMSDEKNKFLKSALSHESNRTVRLGMRPKFHSYQLK